MDEKSRAQYFEFSKIEAKWGLQTSIILGKKRTEKIKEEKRKMKSVFYLHYLVLLKAWDKWIFLLIEQRVWKKKEILEIIIFTERGFGQAANTPG